MTKLFYTETGYDRTIVTFYELVKETKSFYTLLKIGKFNNEFGVNPNTTEIKGDTFRVKKTNSIYRIWNGQKLKENNNYTYRGA
jgi:hypothetical protein